MTAAVLCLCHGRFVAACPSLGYRPVRDIGGPTVLDYQLAPAGGVCGVCGGPYSCGQHVVDLPPPTWGRPYAHVSCPRREETPA